MKRRRVPRLALTLLERGFPENEELVGDLVEEFERRQSRFWFWRQVCVAVATAPFARAGEIRPLRLVDLQPADALERSRRLRLRFRPANPTASPVPGAGGLGLAIFAGLITFVAPAVWGVFLASALAGVAIGIAVIVWRDHGFTNSTTPDSATPD